MTLIDALKAAARGGEWVTPYAMHLVIAQWEVAGIDKQGNEDGGRTA